MPDLLAFQGEAMAEPIGSILDSLGITATREEGELVAGAVVLLKTVQPDGSVALEHCISDGLSWIEAIGMARAAEQLMTRETDRTD